MVNINLKTDGNTNKDKIEWGKTLPLAILILAIVGLAYVAVLFYSKKVDGELKTAKDLYNQKLEDLKKGNVKNVFDFQNRLTESKKMIDTNFNLMDSLREIEKAMVPGVYLNSYQFEADKKSLSLGCIASNYNDVAKQIFSFKKSAYFSDVSSGETSLSGQDGKINFKINLQIK